MKGQLLREYVDLKYDVDLIREASDKKERIVVTALLQTANKLNQNKRIYPMEILEREVGNYRKAVEEGRATGELDHPETSVVSLKNVSHIVREVWWEGPNVMGKVEIVDTPSGRIAKDLMGSGVKLGISSRGVGETNKNNEGYDVVDESFMLIAFDLVSEPSTHEAWLHEGKNLSIEKIREMVPKVDRINRIANEILRG